MSAQKYQQCEKTKTVLATVLFVCLNFSFSTVKICFDKIFKNFRQKR